MSGVARCSRGAYPVGLWSAFIVAIYPSVADSLRTAVRSYPEALKKAFGVGELSSASQYLHAEMLSLIVPLAIGYRPVRAFASGLAGAAESGRLDVLLSAPLPRTRLVARVFAASAVEVAAVLAIALALTMVGSATEPEPVCRSARPPRASRMYGRWRSSPRLSG